MDDLEGIQAHRDLRRVEARKHGRRVDNRQRAQKNCTGQWKRMVQPKDCLLMT